jgi:hypothetical protein
LKSITAKAVLVVFLAVACPVRADDAYQIELPDDYLPFKFQQNAEKLEGKSEFLEGFTISMNLPPESLGGGLSIEALFSLVRNQKVTGTVTYPSGRTTPIDYEIVVHRRDEEIYMKSSLGYFPWEYISVADGNLNMAIYWWYSPPVTGKDIEIIGLAETLLADSSYWHQGDDRECEDDLERRQWSLFCALKYSSLEIDGEYNHHNTAMQSVRFVIDEKVPGHEYAHTLMNYNNEPSTTHEDIMAVLETAKQRIQEELDSPH